MRVSEMDLSRVAWRKSRRSGNGGADCVEVGVWPSRTPYLVRDSKDPDGPVLTFTPSQWGAFVADVKDGAVDDLG